MKKSLEEPEYMMRKVDVISKKGAAALIQWVEDGHTHRATVAETELMDNNEISVEACEQGITYGVPWGELLPIFTVDGKTLENALHDQGIWTYADFFDKPAETMGALHSAFGLTYSRLAQIARDHRTNHKEK